MAEHPSIVLKLSGFRAIIEPDRFVPGSFQLVVDGTPQSHVSLDDPGALFFEYIARMGNVIDLIGLPGEWVGSTRDGLGSDFSAVLAIRPSPARLERC